MVVIGMGYPSIFHDRDARLVASKGYQDMAAPSYVFTIRRVAMMLDEDQELLEEIAE
jgi:hypothetical protein